MKIQIYIWHVSACARLPMHTIYNQRPPRVERTEAGECAPGHKLKASVSQAVECSHAHRHARTHAYMSQIEGLLHASERSTRALVCWQIVLTLGAVMIHT